MPKPLTSNNRKKGLFSKEDFIYEPDHDRYRCPGGAHLTHRMVTEEAGLTMHVYFATASTCRNCTIRAQCTTNPGPRRVRRWTHESVVEAAQARLDEAPEMMLVRRQTAEHPFGTIKAWMGATHFLTKTLPRVKAEMSLHVLAYNMKRAMKILGTG